jgi:hypothetical protein
MTNNRRYGRHISVNLNQPNVNKALSGLALNPRKRLKVTTAHVHATVRSSKQKGTAILEIFRTIGNLPNLATLTVDLKFLEVLPIVALTALLNGKSQLKSLHVSNTRLVAGTPQEDASTITEELNILKKSLLGQSRLKILRLDCCRGDPWIMESLILDPPALTRIAISNTAISRHSSLDSNYASEAVAGFVMTSTSYLATLLQSSPHLQSLSLVNLPLGQISDCHIIEMAEELSSRYSKVTELTLASSILAGESGEAIM